MPKPRPDIPDAQWEGAKKDVQAQAYEALGQSATLRKKYDDAIADFKQALAVQSTPDPATWVRLGQAYEDSGKFDDATDAFDKPSIRPTSMRKSKRWRKPKRMRRPRERPPDPSPLALRNRFCCRQ